MFRRVFARLSSAVDLARLFDLPDRHPDRMIAASIELYASRLNQAEEISEQLQVSLSVKWHDQRYTRKIGGGFTKSS
jgi:hypothetical protein